jgi:hypothetical protein
MEEWLAIFLIFPVLGLTILAMYCVYHRVTIPVTEIELPLIKS